MTVAEGEGFSTGEMLGNKAEWWRVEREKKKEEKLNVVELCISLVSLVN